MSTHTASPAVWGLFQNAVNKTHAGHISRVLKTLPGCFGNHSPHGKNQLHTWRVYFLFCLIFPATATKKTHSTSMQCLENRIPSPFLVILFQDGDTQREDTESWPGKFWTGGSAPWTPRCSGDMPARSITWLFLYHD